MRFIKCISMIIDKIMYSYDDKYFLKRFIKGLNIHFSTTIELHLFCYSVIQLTFIVEVH